jgi:hypothetical protein
MVTIDTYKARTVRSLYRHRVYPPDHMKVVDIADDITGSGDRDTAVRAIRQTAADDFSPIVFVKGSNQQVVSFGRGPPAQLKKEAREWILQWDPDEMPSGLK